MKTDPGFRAAVADYARALRDESDRDLNACALACLAELARREGTDYAAQWAEDQSVRLRSMDAITA